MSFTLEIKRNDSGVSCAEGCKPGPIFFLPPALLRIKGTLQKEMGPSSQDKLDPGPGCGDNRL